jgi:hypothetical protein
VSSSITFLEQVLGHNLSPTLAVWRLLSGVGSGELGTDPEVPDS